MQLQPSNPQARLQAGRQPLLWAALAYSSGILSSAYLWRPTAWWLIAVAVLGLACSYFVRRRPYAALTLILGIFYIAGLVIVQVRPAHQVNFDILRFADGREVTVTGHVSREDVIGRERASSERVDVATENVSADGGTFEVHSGMRLTVYGGLDGALRYGERLRFTTKLQAPRSFRNPGAFDFREYLAQKGIVATASTKAEDVELLAGFAGSRLELWRTSAYRNVQRRIYELWPQEQAALVSAVLLGEQSALASDLETDFQRTGTYHILVVSGLKVGILAFSILWAFRASHKSEFVASLITIAAVLVYAFLTDVGVPVWRAAVMLALYLTAKLLFRQRSTLNTIGLAGLMLLTLDPAELFGASFQLSFLCVLIIAGIITPILERSTRPLARALHNLGVQGYDFALTPRLVQLRLDLRMIAGRLQRFPGGKRSLAFMGSIGRAGVVAAEFILMSALLQAAFALPMAYYFHRATHLSLPANVLVVPLTQILMIAAGVAIGVSYVSAAIARVPALVAGLAIAAMNGSVRWFGSLRMADVRVATPATATIVCALAAIVLTMIAVRRGRWLAVAGVIAILASAAWICFVPVRAIFRANDLEVTSIDVGQGDSILVVSPQGRTMLIDAGGFPSWMHSELDVGEEVVSPYLWSRGISRLDVVALTHAHADHMGGMSAVLRNFHPRELWLGVKSESRELEPLLETARELGIPAVEHRAGDTLEFAGSEIRVLAPARDIDVATSKPNDESLVMQIKCGATAALLEGDAEKKTEREVADENPDADLLKVGHHGSATSTTPELLAAVHPRYAVISVGARNLYGHPRIEVLDRLAAAKVHTYRTDLDGATTFFLDGREVIPQSPVQP